MTSIIVAMGSPVLSPWIPAEEVKPTSPIADRPTHFEGTRRLDSLHQFAQLGSLERASKLPGVDVKDPQGENVGKLRELAVDMESGRVIAAVVATGGLLGVGDELSGIPPSVFRYDIEQGIIALHVSKEALQSAPRFKDAE